MLVQRCCFANLSLLFFFPFLLPSSLFKLPIVVIQKFCYHGNLTSHFYSLLPHCWGFSGSCLPTGKGSVSSSLAYAYEYALGPERESTRYFPN